MKLTMSEKQQAILAEQQKEAQNAKAHADELKRLYDEINELRKELHALNQRPKKRRISNLTMLQIYKSVV